MAQNYLQLKMQSNKQLAITLTNSLRDMHEDHIATLVYRIMPLYSASFG